MSEPQDFASSSRVRCDQTVATELGNAARAATLMDRRPRAGGGGDCGRVRKRASATLESMADALPNQSAPALRCLRDIVSSERRSFSRMRRTDLGRVQSCLHWSLACRAPRASMHCREGGRNAPGSCDPMESGSCRYAASSKPTRACPAPNLSKRRRPRRVGFIQRAVAPRPPQRRSSRLMLSTVTRRLFSIRITPSILRLVS